MDRSSRGARLPRGEIFNEVRIKDRSRNWVSHPFSVVGRSLVLLCEREREREKKRERERYFQTLPFDGGGSLAKTFKLLSSCPRFFNESSRSKEYSTGLFRSRRPPLLIDFLSKCVRGIKTRFLFFEIHFDKWYYLSKISTELYMQLFNLIFLRHRFRSWK